ncbi:hypothetical protein K1Y78_28015 [Streptomyces sp. tea 10]|nr:hypothetical protein [Streptomyces sp. tea 10]
MFLNPAAQGFYCDWADVAQGCVAALRSANPDPDDQRLQELVGELAGEVPTSPACGHATRYGPRRPRPSVFATR